MRIDIATVRDELDLIKSEMARLADLESHYEGLLTLLSGSTAATSTATRGKLQARRTAGRGAVKVGRRSRTRRTAEEMKAETMKIVEFIKAGGAKGRTGGEINSAFFPGGPQGFTTKGRLERYAPGMIKYKGKRARMTYHYSGI